MNLVDIFLKLASTVIERGIYQQMHSHVGADRHQPAQRMQPADQEFVPAKKATSCVAHSCPKIVQIREYVFA